MNSLRSHPQATPRPGTRPIAKALCALLLALPGLAWGVRVDNTAQVTYVPGPGAPAIRLTTNTVSFEVASPSRTPATIEFLRPDTGAADGTDVVVDGGQCRQPDGGYVPLPAVDSKSKTLTPRTTVRAVPTTSYHASDAVLVSVAYVDGNVAPTLREFIDVELATSDGDAETLRLQETGVDTGVFAGAIPGRELPPPFKQYDCALSIAEGTRITARFDDAPNKPVAEAAGLAPVDGAQIRLEQVVSKDLVEVGETLQYTLVVRNIDTRNAKDVQVRNVLPVGLRFQAGTLRVGSPVASAALSAGGNGAGTASASAAAPAGGTHGALRAMSDPEVEGDGRTFRFPVGDLAPGEHLTATFVATVGAGAPGQHLINYAIATANGTLSSNETDTVVHMRESLDKSRFTIIGRVLLADSCDGKSARKGVPAIRLLMEDGTYAGTDAFGAYHFEGVRPGTHVVQVDPASVPADLEVAPCIHNTRFAGRGDSQFVEAQGGTLWRGDFYLRKRPPVVGAVGASLQLQAVPAGIRNVVEIDGGAVAVGNLRVLAILPAGATVVPGSATVDGAPAEDPEVKGNFAIFRLGDAGAHWRRRVSFDTAGGCGPDGYAGKASVLFESIADGSGRTPTAEANVRCRGSGPGGDAATGQRVETTLTAAASMQAASSRPGAPEQDAVLDDATAAGGGRIDWLRGLADGRDWLFPAADYNPRTPVTRVVVKHRQGESVALRLNGAAVDPIRFDGQRHDGKGMAVSTWRSVHLVDGDNLLEATVTDGAGKVVAQLSRTVHFSGDAARVVYVPERSYLVADGIHGPLIAVRLLDSTGKPVRKGASGEFTVAPPYQAAQSVQEVQGRQALGLAERAVQWHVAGDDGIALVELAPTGSAGVVKLGFDFKAPGDRSGIHEDVEAWLKSSPRDWVVVGFARGSVGYETLRENMAALQPGEDGTGVRADGQVSLYAKGRVLGKWLLTLAYDSDKPTGELRDRSLLSTIDPGQYYTLYGDGSQQAYDASSARKLYLKLERDQFYALFGDFQTGLDRNQLSRYQRTLNGVRVEYRGPLVEFNGFAARTAQYYARDEIQGDGTSGLYRLERRDLVINSERVRIETRDRYHSEQILETKELARHIDYDIDYDNGTLFFRSPVASRDFNFNPNWIVVEYETAGSAEQHLDAGGRAGVKLMDGRLEAGVTYIRNEDAEARNQLAGVDAKFKLTARDEIRAEAAATRRDADADADADGTGGNAWLLEWEHRGETLNLLAYARRQASDFGLGQQNGFETGMAKRGVQAQYKLGSGFSLQGEAYRLENLADDATRDAVRAEAVYQDDAWRAHGGLQWARDAAADGRVAESQQVVLGVNKGFLGGRLDLGVEAEFSPGGKSESVDFPARVQLTAGYRITEGFRVLAAQEFSAGKDRDTATTRVGFEAKPWKDATVTSTLNQSRIGEYGPRTFAQMGLDQKIVLDSRWSMDLAMDSSQAFKQSGDASLVVDPSQPVQAGGIGGGNARTEDFVALSGGVTYRSALWLWNARLEGRHSEGNDRYGFTSGFLRQMRDGVVMSASARAFVQRNADGSTGRLVNAQGAWAWRPMGSDWSVLEKLEFRLDDLDAAATGDSRAARVINNLVLNHASSAWGDNAEGSALDVYQRSQLSLYYGSKYVIDSYDGSDYAGYTDILGVEARFDLTPRVDFGLRATVLHTWRSNTFAWAFGPSVGFTPFTNAWVSVGYNIRGFNDRDFESTHYTAEGAYLVFRMKFDQHTLGLDRGDTAH